MRSRLVQGAFVIGLFALAVGLFVPTLIDATENNADQTIQLGNESSEELTETLTVIADEVSLAGNESTVTLEDSRTLSTNTTTINATETEDVDLSGDTVSVTLDEVTDENQAQLTVEYPPMFGWDDAPRTFFSNAGILVAILAMAMVLGLLYAGFKI